MPPVVGTAGWSLPAKDAERFPGDGSALQRYAARFAGVEINSSFHRPHRRSTWQRWGESVPEDFRFAAKIPKTITHGRKLVACEDLVAPFLEEIDGLGGKLAVLLLQLPPKLVFDTAVVESFLDMLVLPPGTRLVCEPRHPSWFDDAPDALLDRFEVARVAADPACVPAAALPGGWPGLAYFRLHGSPHIYRSSYDGERLDRYADLIRGTGYPAWCMFDNTAGSAASANALDLMARL